MEEDDFIELKVNDEFLELSRLKKIETVRFDDIIGDLKKKLRKKAKTKRCPNCGYKMRRLYVKQGYRKIIRRTVKHKTFWWKVGWWCPLCDYVEISPELPRDNSRI